MNKQEILEYVEKKFQKKEAPEFRVGDSIRVHVRIREGNTSRVQVFEGVVISIKGSGPSQMFTVRKLSFGIGVERIFPLASPIIEKIQILRSGHVRRAKLYYLRNRVGKAARLEEREAMGSSKAKNSGESAQNSATSEVEPPREVLLAAEEK